MIITLKFRVKDATVGKHLNRHAWACNQVWNYCNQIQREAQARWKAGVATRWPSAFDLIKLCTGSAADLGLHSDTVQTICREYAVKRDANRGHLRWRASGGPKRALGWVPFIPRAVKIDGAHCTYLKRKFYFWKSREIEGAFKAGSFVQDARGRWYVCFQCEVAEAAPKSGPEIGIDLGLKTLAVLSNGREIKNPTHFRRYEAALAVAQRAGNKRRAKAIHAKITNARRHFLHEQSTMLVEEFGHIVVGNVSSSKLAKTRMAKSVLDAGWSSFRHMLSYKAQKGGAMYTEANERMTSRTCSCCGTAPDSSPKGMSALGVRHWVCSDCGASHHRDVNAAKNILRVGQERLALVGEIPVL
jgi:putative transposase